MGYTKLSSLSGVHHIFNLLESQLVANTGANPFNAIITVTMTAQGAATVAVGVKTKNPKLKALAFPRFFLPSLVLLSLLFSV